MIIDFNVWDDALAEKIEKFKQNPTGITKVILNGATEYQYNSLNGSKELMNDLISFTDAHGIELHIITAAHSSSQLLKNSQNLHIHHWPTFWLTLLLTRLEANSNYRTNFNNGLNINLLRTNEFATMCYPYITMNKAPKVHRSIMMDMLYKNEILSNGVVIWREPSRNYKYRYWTEEILLRDQKERFVSQEIVPEEYAMSLIQLVTESDEYLFSLSEKTGMPLYFNKPFLVAGCKNFHAILESMGFKLYDELFDYSFDSVDDIDVRYDMIAQNIKRYADKSPAELTQLYNSVFEKCVYNKKVALRLATNTDLIPDIWKDLVEHHLQNNIPDYPDDINKFIKSREDEFRF